MTRFFYGKSRVVRFNFMWKELVELHLASGEAPPTSQAKRFSSEEVPHDVMSIREAAGQVGVSNCGIRRMLKQGILSPSPGFARLWGANSWLVVSRGSVEQFLKERESLVEAREAARILGVSQSLLGVFHKEGVLSAKTVSKRHHSCKYNRSQIENLQRAICQHMLTDEECAGEELVSVAYSVAHYVTIPGRTRKSFVEAIRDGRIRVVRRDAGRAGLPQIFVRRSDVMRFARMIANDDSNLPSLKEAVAQPGIGGPTIQALWVRERATTRA